MLDITDFDIGQGETFKILLQLQDRSAGNIPLDITEYVFAGQVRENYTTEEVAANFSFEKITPFTSGSTFVSLTAEETEQLTQRHYVYDIKTTYDGITRRVLEGRLVVRPAVTR
jgi:hypothetical protein